MPGNSSFTDENASSGPDRSTDPGLPDVVSLVFAHSRVGPARQSLPHERRCLMAVSVGTTGPFGAQCPGSFYLLCASLCHTSVNAGQAFHWSNTGESDATLPQPPRRPSPPPTPSLLSSSFMGQKGRGVPSTASSSVVTPLFLEAANTPLEDASMQRVVGYIQSAASIPALVSDAGLTPSLYGRILEKNPFVATVLLRRLLNTPDDALYFNQLLCQSPHKPWRLIESLRVVSDVLADVGPFSRNALAFAQDGAQKTSVAQLDGTGTVIPPLPGRTVVDGSRPTAPRPPSAGSPSSSSSSFPPHFIARFISTACQTCNAIQDMLPQQRVARLICIFLTRLIRSASLSMEDDIAAEVQTFAVTWMRLQEANTLFRALRGNAVSHDSGASGHSPHPRL